MPSNKAPCRLTLRVGTMRRIGLPLASIPAIRTCSFACIRGSRRFPIIAALLSQPASTAAGIMSQSPERCQDYWCNGDITTVVRLERSVGSLPRGRPYFDRLRIQIDTGTHFCRSYGISGRIDHGACDSPGLWRGSERTQRSKQDYPAKTHYFHRFPLCPVLAVCGNFHLTPGCGH